MADGPSLGDFFAKKKKKNLKGSNLNNDVAQPKAEEKKSKTAKDKEEEGWEDEQQVVAPTMMVQVAGVLTKEEDTKEQEQSSVAAWGNVKKEKRDLNEKRFPSLAKAMLGQSSNINIDDGSNPNINIKTSKNVFAALDNEEDEEDTSAKRPKEIKPAMVKKQRGELQSQAVQREVSKYSAPGKSTEKKRKDEDEEDEEEVEAPSRTAKKKEKKERAKAQDAEEEKDDEEVEADAADLHIEVDEKASRAKYFGRQKLPTLLLSQRELQEEKAPKAAPAQAKGKKKRFVEEEEDRPKLLVADWD